MADIFISYKHEEQQIAKKLADALQKKGWTVWWDPEVLTGERFHDIIDTELKESKCVVVLWSKLSVESENVKDEATYALKRKKLVPITIEDVDLPYWAERINTGQLINWDGSDNFPGYQKLVSDITKIIAEEDKRRRKEAEREAEKERRRKQEEERKRREEEQRKAAEEWQRLEEEKQRLAEEERKQKEEETKRKAEEEKRRKEKEELKRISEEKERKRKEAEEKRLFDEEKQRKEVKPQIKPDKPEPGMIQPPEPKPETKAPTEPRPSQPISPKPRKASNALIFGAVVGIIVLLMTGGWFYYKYQQEQQEKETRIEIERFDEQIEELERSAAKADNQEQIKGLYEQRDTLSHQVEGFVEKATKVGLESQLEQLQDRLKQVQIQLANKEKELIAARKGKVFLESVPDNANVKILNIDEPFQQGMELQPGGYHFEVSMEGYESQKRSINIKPGEEKRINFELEKITPRVARLHVETVPEYAAVRILNIKPKFVQGMELEPGSYHMEVAAEGYETGRRWIDLVAGHNVPVRFELTKIKVVKQIAPQKTIANSIGMNFVLIPAGNFTMGSPPNETDRKDDEKQHEVIISKPFYLQTTEVSQEQWEKVVGNNPSFFKKCGDDCPVDDVSWDDAQKFIEKLNQMEGTKKYRLPSEAEWEYACRAGTTTIFSFGNELNKLREYAWYSANSEGLTHPVSKKKSNAWGLYDMHGNVFEWCLDWYRDYPSNSVVDPKGPDKGETRVLRGGSWYYSAQLIRSANRFGLSPESANPNYGFRVARDP